MKKQIRTGMFETNSSSMHALVFHTHYGYIKEGSTYYEDLPSNVELPKKVYFEDKTYIEDDALKTIEGRLQIIFNYLTYYEYGKKLVNFLGILNDIGIAYELPNTTDCWGCSDCPIHEHLLEEIVDNKGKLLAFIYAYDVWYDTFCDEDCDDEQIDRWDDEVAKRANEPGAVYMFYDGH